MVQVTGQVPLVPLTIANCMLITLGLAIGAVYLRRLHRQPARYGSTWGCGYLAPSPRIQYTGTSFSEMVVNLLGTLVAPRRQRPGLDWVVLPRPAHFHYEVTETVLNQVLTPVFHWTGLAFSYVRRLQHGQIHVYMLYIFVTLFVLMIWTH